MAVLRRLDCLLLTTAPGKTVLGPVVTTGSAVLLRLPADPQPSPLLLGRSSLVVLGVCGTLYGVRLTELERASSETPSRDVENRLGDLILTTRNESVAAANHAEEADVGVLRSSLCGLETQAAGADLVAAATARAYLALPVGDGLAPALGLSSVHPSDEDSV